MKNKIDWVTTIFLITTPILGLGLLAVYLATEIFNSWFLLLFVSFYGLTVVSITAGYHRLFAHKTYEAHWSLRLFYTLFGAAAFQQSIIVWATDHRYHHRHVDTEKDPYSIKKGFWHAHLFWMFYRSEHKSAPQYRACSKDLKKDPMVIWQDKYYFLIASFMCFVLPMIIGYFMGSILGGLVFGGLLRLAVCHHATFFINSACHYWGKQTYTKTNSAKDNSILALFTFGEGYHNFHHFFQNDYRNGVRWFHWDPTKWWIYLNHKLGVASMLRRTPYRDVVKAKMSMVELDLRPSLSDKVEPFFEQLTQLRKNWEEASLRWYELKEIYVAAKKEAGRERLNELKLELKQARLEMEMYFRQWKLCRSSIYQLA